MQDISAKISQVVVDLGFRAVEADNPGKSIIRRGKFKSLSPQQKGWLRRRQAAEPAIGHLKSDHRMDRCWLQGALGDALHAISCAAGYNIRWLLRVIVRLGVKPVLCVCFKLFCRYCERYEFHRTLVVVHGPVSEQLARQRDDCEQHYLGHVAQHNSPETEFCRGNYLRSSGM